MPITKLLASLSLLLLNITVFACPFDGNENNAGTLTPAAGYQTISTSNGDYFAINVSCGDTYNFNFCNNGGTSTWDTQITILETNGTTELAYNDDNCGLQSDVTWQASFTGTVYVLITEYFCNLDGTFNATMAYNVTAGSLSGNASFTLTATNCVSATANITGDTGGTFSFNPAPVDAATINPTTGAISNGTAGATYNVDYTVNCSSTNQSVTLPNSGNAAFSLTEVCGGATANVLGDVGGTFAFNPVPTDGAQINTTTGAITNGTAGNSYTVEYTICGSTTSESVTVLTDDCWTLNGNATNTTIGGEDCIQLTAAVNNQTGCAWSGSQIDFATDFSLTLDYYFGNNINGADGNTFTFQPSASTACGNDGGQLGAGGLANALAIEFDTYDNDNPMHVYDMACDHIAIEVDGDHQNAAPAAGPVCAKTSMGNIDDGGTYEVTIDWNATTQTLSVFFDGVLRLTYNNDIVNNVFGGQSLVYWGATSATGGLNNQQYFCPSTVVILPVGLTSFSSECHENDEIFTWKTSSEVYVSHFVLEYTYDGYIFYPQVVVQAIGNSTTEHIYQARVSTKDPNTRYYRLKAVDMNGSFENSDLISSKSCMTASLLQSVYQEGSTVHVKSNQPATIQLINNMGQVFFNEITEGKVSFETSHLAAGMYQVVLLGEDGTKELESIMVP
ncbi:MAG: T9SS type A sorting domain-containing protein [Fluviicola sp.]